MESKIAELEKVNEQLVSLFFTISIYIPLTPVIEGADDEGWAAATRPFEQAMRGHW